MQMLIAPLTETLPATSDFSAPQAADGEVIVKPLRQFPVHSVLVWNTQDPVMPMVNGVRPNLIVRHLSETSPGVRLDPMTGGLDYTVTVAGWHNDGFVRVDHLLDAKGEPMGLPSRDVYRSAAFNDFSRRLMDTHRLRQLARELRTIGVRLKGDMSPNLPAKLSNRVMDILSAHRSKDVLEVRNDRREKAKVAYADFVANLTAAVRDVPAIIVMAGADERVAEIQQDARLMIAEIDAKANAALGREAEANRVAEALAAEVAELRKALEAAKGKKGVQS